jgi:hypothetical protein
MQKRLQYLTHFCQCLCTLLKSFTSQNSLVYTNRRFYKEFVPIIVKVQTNFQVRDLSKAGLLMVYLESFLQFTLDSIRIGSQNQAIMSVAQKLCFVWCRIMMEA